MTVIGHILKRFFIVSLWSDNGSFVAVANGSEKNFDKQSSYIQEYNHAVLCECTVVNIHY